jgi:tetrapyrrole methylase family protein/MazG family protein
MSKEIDRLIDIVATLRGPDGCPWDKKQDHTSIGACMLEELHELFEAVEQNDAKNMCEELGDLLLHILFHAQIAKENGRFTIDEVAASINEKLIRRHPHVFGDTKVSSTQEVLHNWETIKNGEKGKESRTSALDGVPRTLPALLKAEKLQKKAARVGFDWDETPQVLDKVEEEFREFTEAAAQGHTEQAREELGDVLFSIVNVARHYGFCAEDALRAMTEKFTRRFQYVEERFRAQDRPMQEASLEEMDGFWEESKTHE